MLETIFSWNTLWWVLIPIYIAACLGLIVIVLLQKGKGTGFAGAFGVGPGSDTVFGPRARKSLPVRLTYIMAATFMILSLSLSLIVGRQGRGVAPDAVPEDSVEAAQSKALDSLFGKDGSASTAPATAPVDGAATTAPAVTPAPAAPTTAAPATPEPQPAPAGQ